MKSGRSDYVSSINQESARSPTRTPPSEGPRNIIPTSPQPATRSNDSTVVSRQLSVPPPPTMNREPVQRQTSLPAPLEEKKTMSTIAMMNGLPKTPVEEKTSFFNKAKSKCL